MNIENYNLFFKTMFERHKIWENRFILHKEREQWTTNQLFKKYKFTNVYRQLDRSSQFLINKYIRSNDNLTNIIFKCLLYKFFNRSDAFISDLVIPSVENYERDSKEFFKSIKQYKKVLFHNAYSTYRNAKHQGFQSNIDGFQRKAFPYIHQNIYKIEELVVKADIQNLIKFFTSIYMIGGFLAHEFFLDMTYIPKYNQNFKDLKINGMMYTNLGPGSAEGLKMIFPDKKQYNNDFKYGYKILMNAAEKQLAKYGDFYYIKWDHDHYTKDQKFNFTYSQIQHWLCQFYKYITYLKTPQKKHKKFIQHTF